MSLRPPFFLGLLMLLACGCGRDEAVASAVFLERGVVALEQGDDEAALAACRQAATLAPDDGTAQECLMVAGIRRQNWELANQAAARLVLSQDQDGWLLSIANQISRRANPTVETALKLSSPQNAWACLESPCLSVAPAGDPQMSWLVALVHAHRDDTKAALAVLADMPAGSPGEDLQLMLLLRDGQYEAMREGLASSPCTPENRALRQALRNAVAPDLALPTQCTGTGGALPTGAAAALNSALAEMASLRYDAARAYLRAAKALAPGAQLPVVYEYLLALLTGDDAVASAALTRCLPEIPANWQTWLTKVPQRPVL